MAETINVGLSSGTEEFTPPSKELAPTQQTQDNESSSSIAEKMGALNATGNEILDRFLQNTDEAQHPIETWRTAGARIKSTDNVHDLQYAMPKTTYTQVGKENIPPLLQDLYGKIQVARSSHIFPRGSQERVGPFIHWADKGDSRLFGESQYKGSEIQYPIEKVCQIVDASQDCEVSNKSENVLRDEVVVRVLSQAIKLSGLRDAVKLEHVISAEISPSSLIQTLHGIEGPFLPLAKKIDYCLYLHQDPAMERKVADFLASSVPFGRSINQTDESRTRLSLPLISIKVTKSLSQEDPLIPLSVWASAGLERAAELFEKRAKVSNLVPAILISVKGPQWYVMFMYLDYLPVGQLIRRLHGQIPIGSTLDVKDCCGLISSLVCLIKWTEKKNRQFLEAYLPPVT